MVEMTQETGLVSVGGRRLAYARMGSGSPVVVLECAGGTPRQSWDPVMPAIAGFTQVISYDRAGLGESERAPRRRTLADLTRDLTAVVEAAAPRGPYILVGHSIGGHIIRLFAQQHPGQVAGMVFIDSNHPDLERLQRDLLPPPSPGESDYIQGMRQWLTQEYVEDPGNAEGIDFFACADEARETGPFGDVPLVVITAGNHAKDVEDPGNAPGVVPSDFSAAFDRLWQALQQDLTRLSTRGRQVIARDSGHFVQSHEPALVISVIKAMVDAYRGSEG